ncbi:S8 family peptidase [Taibaiella koreensis]|uniref:S8 family peptidase n=1 Tax=Taibaiella koreensis TaxID=1268548 RepID=UPI000E5A05A8|nr:S8 family peptidase [Taibaiella koreensis]
MRNFVSISLAFAFLTVITHSARAQNPQYAFRVTFADKQPTTYTLSDPSAYLSPRAIARRATFSIATDSSDLPVVQSYIDSVLRVTGGILHNRSRWQNSCVVLLEDSAAILSLQSIAFIRNVKKVAYYPGGLHHKPGPSGEGNGPGHKPTGFDIGFYNSAWSQIHLCNGEYLHEQGYMGEGKLIAVVDVGFSGVNTAAVYDSLFQQNRLADTWNFIYDTAHVFDYSNHGSQVLSCMAAYIPEVFVGTAPRASYALYLSDDAGSEQAIEEDNFAAAVERADSLGADLVTTSLGYNTFDDPADSHVYSELDGKTTLPARTANAAVRKGIFVAASAGNEGDTPWQHILTPGDADSAMTVGSVDQAKTPASSSGKGPNAAGLLKPNVCGKGVQDFVINPAGIVAQASGTSYATPVIAGLTACLMQSLPTWAPLKIRSLIESVSDSFAQPNNNVGNGVPDFKRAYITTGIAGTDPKRRDELFRIYPNPAIDEVYVQGASSRGVIHYQISDMQGRRLGDGQVNVGGSIATNALVPGLYLLHLDNGNQQQVIKLSIR